MRPLRPKRIVVFLLLGVLVTVMVCFALAATDDLSTGIVSSAEGYFGDDRWSITRYDRPAGVRVVSQWSGGRNWSPGQALGPPDTFTGGDQVTAWASSSADGQREWLLLDFATPVIPKSVRVYEMCSTGALEKVEVTRSDGSEVVAWSGVDPLPRNQSMGTSEVALSGIDSPISRIRLHFDSPNVSGWNEVDAVGLVAKDGSEQYAVAAQASSIYASGYATPTPTSLITAANLVPSWSGIDKPTTTPNSYTLPSGKVDRTARRATTIVEARGWPMLALAGRKQLEAAAAAPNAVAGYLRSPYSGAMPSGLYTSRLLVGSVGYSSVPNKPVMLYRPIPLGFAVNTLLAALLLWLLYTALTVPRRFLRELSRLRRGCCVTCGYDVRYDFVGGCPECGWNRERWAGESEIRSSKSETNSKSEDGKFKKADSDVVIRSDVRDALNAQRPKRL